MTADTFALRVLLLLPTAYDFTYDLETPCELDDDLLDKVLVPRRG